MSTIQLSPDTYINRELSTIEFQRRVLALAKQPDMPLLERLKFIAIVGNNLDEMFMVRVGSYIQKVNLGIGTTRPDGYTPSQLLWKIRDEVTALFLEQREILHEVFELLEAQDVVIRELDQLSFSERRALNTYFSEQVFPVLTPLAVDHARPFPFISNLSVNLAIYLQRSDDTHAEVEFARLKIPDILPRLINVKDVVSRYADIQMQGDHFIWIEDLIIANLSQLFPGMDILEAHPFRVVRNSDIDYENEDDEELRDVKSIIEQSIRERRYGSVVRLGVPHTFSQEMLQRLVNDLGVHPNRDIYFIDTVLGSAALMEMLSIDRPDLKDPPFAPRQLENMLGEGNLFTQIRQQDIVMHHPYDSFKPVEDFFRTAARDPDVLAIKATLYRVGKNSPVVDALLEARDNQKQVAVLVELKARFDEQNNLEWVRALEAKGVHVVYGVEELPVKTHAKIALVVRREVDGVRRYVHLSTGNYNASTARLYTDIGLFTCNEELADDATRLFNRLTGYAPHTNYKRLLVAPEFLLPELLALIDNEIEAARAGKQAWLVLKMNQLEEDQVITKLYEASQAGVQVDLIVRGLCCIRPGIPGVSERIRVISVVGRFLEHSRIYYFHNAPDEQKMYVGSADLMRRNLLNRVETVFPLLDERVRHRVLRLLLTSLNDNVGAWELQPDDSYRLLHPDSSESVVDSQAYFMEDSFGFSLNQLEKT